MVQQFRLELTHASLKSPIILHCVGPAKSEFEAPPSNVPETWYSLRDTKNAINNLDQAQPSRQILPKTLAKDEPITAKLFFNDEEILTASAAMWSYDDYEHLCFIQFTSDFKIECPETDTRERKPMSSYWRDTTESRYAAMMVFAGSFFNAERVTQLKRLSCK